jgi:LuxR family maltose regulon positive regulatory protein
MSEPLILTKLYIPSLRSKIVIRPRLIERLTGGMHCKLTLISAPAGFGKSTLVSEWVAGCERSEPKVCVAWLSLDEGDNDPTRFLTYLVAALQTLAPKIGAGVLAALQSPQPPSIESNLTVLLNEIAAIPDNFILVLDDYHLIDAQPIDQALTFLLDHLPPQMHLVITTREDPSLPLPRYRVRGQLTELRAADLRFTPAEAADFLNRVMSLNLAAEDIAALETRTEGWIAGLQLAAISMQGHQDTASFIKSFTGSHHFVLDYLVEEVLHQQSKSIQTFLLRTSILDRLIGPLCDAVLLDPSVSGQETLEYLERANLFIVPLDNERRWYRYHHLFADLLRQRLHQSSTSSTGDEGRVVAEYHVRASQWYEDHGMELEAFHHAAAANDIERAERLIEGKGMPLYFRGALAPLLSWLETLPTTVLDSWPSLWTTYASVSLATGQAAGIEQKLQAAEAALAAALQGAEPDDKTRDLIGRIAAIRATLAIYQNQIETIICQSRRALEYLHPNNLAFRTFTTWKLAVAYQIQGDRPAAVRAFTEALSIAQSSGNIITTIVATVGLGGVQKTENQLHLAAETYRRVLQLAVDLPFDVSSYQANLGLAHIYYEWNDLEAAEQHGQQSAELSGHIGKSDEFIPCELFLARLKLARRDVAGAAAILAKVDQYMHQHNFIHRLPEVAAAQVLTLLHQGDLDAAAHLAQKHELPISQARVYLAQGYPSAALGVLEPLRQQAEAKGWEDERLKVIILEAIAHHAHGEKDKAAQLMGDALALAEPGGFIRIFVDEGPPMAALLREAAKHGTVSNYVRQLLAAFGKAEGRTPVTQLLIEPLSEREFEVLRLLGTELNGPEIARELMVSLNTMRTHTKSIYNKLGVNSRQMAIRRAEELDLL